ncbi:AAA family ATPase [Saxibacter everestensis]|uniref:AAA family ATPase n=1 Tax=Saxibacter everestensis TaxID=2909229 RepID=A0ABY8QYR6_9MICO|nr:AAA family ATPase [Brevibacteriaceae bacterium ZFBP1038]
MGGTQAEIDVEQANLDQLYGRLDALRIDANQRLASIRRTSPGGNHQARSERDAFATLYEDQIVRLNSAEDRLCFGRLDLADSTVPRYIGRIGLSDEDQQRLLIDWRAPAAEPFYQATSGSPAGVARRRHLITRGRSVTGIEDDVLDLGALTDSQRAELSGEGALIAALESNRTGRMGDIVATIQSEQDRIIRREMAGVLVVQGGPGTGKTAVALHRAAYLLYKHRERIARSGVLLVGPSPVFLRYIEQVLPSLGETGAVLTTAGNLFPGVETNRHDGPEVAALKGDARMARVLRRAIAARQRIPEADQDLDVEGRIVTLTRAAVRSAREKARRTNLPHNEARVTFVKQLLRQLTDQLGEAIGGTIDQGDRAELLNDVRSSRDVRIALNLAWMPLIPQKFVADLFAHPERLAAATPEFSSAERELLGRDAGAPWTVEDVPLLDEAAELIGEDPQASARAEQDQQADSAEQLKYAQSVLEMTGTEEYLTAGSLAERFANNGRRITTAERATEDRTWAYGHLVVDEAQELSPMMWRLLFRRVPSRSATLVGDIAQTSSPAGTRDWAQVLAPHVGNRWQLEELTINYRTPGQIMKLAAETITADFPDLPVPSSVREGKWAPDIERFADDASLLAALPTRLRHEKALLDGGKIAVIAPDSLLRQVHDAIGADGITLGVGPGGLDADIALMSPTDVKGLEFDGVLVVQPGTIRGTTAGGLGDLYVSLTRPTQRLAVVTTDDFGQSV